jgi:hypothetical protein
MIFFHEHLNVLINDGRIYNKNGKDSYYINKKKYVNF